MVPKNRQHKVIIVATDQELTNEHYRRRLWIAVHNLSISRRRWPDVIASAIYDFRGELLDGGGRQWAIPEIDEVLGDDRWISYWLEANEHGLPRRETRLLARLRLFDTAIRILYPHLAAQIRK